MKTKENILDAAIKLFNQKGTKAVSTNHIAVELGISPGNLYYYYKNKEDIINAIFVRMINFMDDNWIINRNATPSSEMERMLMQVFKLQLDYKFFHSEIISLLRNDPKLAQRYNEIRTQRLAEITDFMRWMIVGGILRDDIEEETFLRLAEHSWFIGNFWHIQFEIGDMLFYEQEIKKAILLTIDIYKPYLTKAGISEFDSIINKYKEK